ncbi:hypothetical protein C2G38_2052707 [Gigaspora rosea]|uniref:Uncharacterized protein n=1 Tax=Gigaspora rosea TaxID=44941 RepID=A0A397WAL4_9GLOM|nr:hypothetical protein C2G38_2052707 [Gigaspora rosea]
MCNTRKNAYIRDVIRFKLFYMVTSLAYICIKINEVIGNDEISEIDPDHIRDDA